MRVGGLFRRRFWIAFPIIVVAVVAPAATAFGTGVWTQGSGYLPLHPHAGQPRPPLDNQDHLYVLDGWGGVHPVGASPALTGGVLWPHRDLAQSLGVFPDGTGGYVMDAFGGLHPVGSAPAAPASAAWPDWNIAREVVMAPWSSSADPAGYVLDGWGGIHPFGDAPAVTGNAYWPRVDIARGMVLSPNSTPDTVTGYTLDGYGGVHPFGGAPQVDGYATWPGFDIARGIMLNRSDTSGAVTGYSLDGYGGIHPFGGAPAIKVPAYWPQKDMADSIVGWTASPAGSPGGWVLDREGGVHAFGSAPTLAATASWPGWDIARGLGGSGAGSGSGSFEQVVLAPEPVTDGWGTYFNQRDARWAATSVGPSPFPVWKIGCLLSDLAMVYSHFGYRDVTPATIAAQAGLFRMNGAILNGAFSVPGHPATINRKPTWAWISAKLAAGHPVIVGMNLDGGGTHFVTLTGLNGADDYWTNDPWEQNAIHVPFSGDWPDRGQVYEAIAFS